MQQVHSITEELKWRGYENETGLLIPSQNLLDINELIKEAQTNQYQLRRLNLKHVLENSQRFLRENFVLQKVPYYNEIKFGPIKIEQEGEIHPFNLPVKKRKGEDTFYGCLREVLSIQDDKTISSSYRLIELSRHLTELSQLSYTHEITHSQLNHVKGLIKRYRNIEVLSIFLETVQAYEDSERLLHIHDEARLYELSGIIEELNKHHNSTNQEAINIMIEGSSYAESTLKAYNLFLRYYYGSINTRKYLLYNVQRVFNQEMSLEDLLQELDITLENSQDIHTLSKYLHR